MKETFVYQPSQAETRLTNTRRLSTINRGVKSMDGSESVETQSHGRPQTHEKTVTHEPGARAHHKAPSADGSRLGNQGHEFMRNTLGMDPTVNPEEMMRTLAGLVPQEDQERLAQTRASLLESLDDEGKDRIEAIQQGRGAKLPESNIFNMVNPPGGRPDIEDENTAIPGIDLETVGDLGTGDPDIQRMIEGFRLQARLRLTHADYKELRTNLINNIRRKNISIDNPQLVDFMQRLAGRIVEFEQQEAHENQNMTPQERQDRESIGYNPPDSIEDLIRYNMKYSPQKYQEDGEFPLIDPETRRVNFENLVRRIHELANTRGSVSPRAPVNYFGVLNLRYGFNNFSLEQVLLYDEIGTLFKPDQFKYEKVVSQDGKVNYRKTQMSAEEFKAYQKAYIDVRDSLRDDLWGRQRARDIYAKSEFGGAIASDTEFPKVIVQEFQDNVFTTGNNLEHQLNLSSPFSYTPEKMKKRADQYMRLEDAIRRGDADGQKQAKEEINALDDNIVGQLFRMGMDVYGHINDYHALTRILGDYEPIYEQKPDGTQVVVGRKYIEGSAERNSPFFRKYRYKLADPKNILDTAYRPTHIQTPDNPADADQALQYEADLSDPLAKDYMADKDWFDDEGRLLPDKVIGKTQVKGEFIKLVNPFNEPGKELPLIDDVHERLIYTLAERAYLKFKERYEDDPEFLSRFKDHDAVEDALWKNAFESARYAHENAWYWTAVAGLNAFDNDPAAGAHRAMTRLNVFDYYNKQLADDRGQFPGNQYLLAGVTRLSTTMTNGIETLDHRTIADVISGRGRDDAKDIFDYDGRVDDVKFSREAMSRFAADHVNRVFKLYRDIIEAKEMGLNAFVSRDTSPWSGARIIIDRTKAQEVFSKWKDMRYIFNTVPLDQKIRVKVGQDKYDNYIYKEMTIAEAFFSKDLLRDYLAKEDRYEMTVRRLAENHVVEEDVVAPQDIVAERDMEINGVEYKKGDVIYKKGATVYHEGDTVPEGTDLVNFNLEVKKGEVDPKQIADPNKKKYIWKEFLKYFIAAELRAHRNKKDPINMYTFGEVEKILGFLESIPAGALYGQDKDDVNDRSMDETRLTSSFFSEDDIKWIRKISKTQAWRVGGGEFAYYSMTGSVEGIWKLFKYMFIDSLQGK